MANYNMIQKHSDNIVTPSTSLTLTSFPHSSTSLSDEKMQQLVVQTTFQAGVCYLISLKLPQNDDYDLNYGIRLLNLNGMTSGDLSKISNYQLVKYISFPRVNINTIDTSTIWHYTFKDDKSIINAAIAKPLSERPQGEDASTIAQRANKFYYDEDEIYYYDTQGNIVLDDNNQPKNYYNHIDYKIITSINSFTGAEPEYITKYFLVTPEQTYDCMYLYLKPITDDRYMSWKEGNISMIGRHINLPDQNIAVKSYVFQNTDNLIQNVQGIVKHISIWGRSEQLISINGQELQLGPSGYYELKDFDINSLYIVNSAVGDKYTVDIQYQNNNS